MLINSHVGAEASTVTWELSSAPFMGDGKSGAGGVSVGVSHGVVDGSG